MRMMPQIQGPKKTVLMTTQFLGYNHNEAIQDGEMYDMQNLSGDLFPMLSPRKKRGITSWDVSGQDPVPIRAISGRDQLVHIRGSKIYYNFIEIEGITLSQDTTMLPKKIVHMGAYVCVWPDKVYFNTIDLTDKGSMERSWNLAGNLVGLSMCRLDGTDYDETQIIYSTTAPNNPVNGDLWMDQSGEDDVLRQWSVGTQMWTEVPTVYIKISATGIGTGIGVYDAVHMSGLEAPDGASDKIKAQVAKLNDKDMIIYGRGEGYIIVVGTLSGSLSALKATTVHADRNVPDLDWICESNNRLWGCRYGLEGTKVVNELRCCKLGDFKNWNCYMGLSTDSYRASIGTDGPFTGAITQKGYPVFFKEQCIHRVSGYAPSSFQITTTMCRGVQRGSGKSVAVVNEMVLYKSRQDVMMYDGSMPVSISAQLGKMMYEKARAGVLGGKYYICMQSRTGRWVQMCYDTERSVWYKEDDIQAEEYASVGDELYCIDARHNTLVAITGSRGTIEEDFDWAAVFGMFGTDYRGKKYLGRFDIRMYMEEGGKARLWIQYDSSGNWEYKGEIQGRRMKNFVVPVVPRRCDHMRVKITGKGEMRIYSISRIMEVGSDA